MKFSSFIALFCCLLSLSLLLLLCVICINYCLSAYVYVNCYELGCQLLMMNMIYIEIHTKGMPESNAGNCPEREWGKLHMNPIDASFGWDYKD